MANSSAKKQGIASHLRRLALLHGYQARTNRLAGYQPMQNHGERVALISPAPAPAPQPACKKKSGCGCGGRCKKKNLIPAAAALNSHMRRNGKTLGDDPSGGAFQPGGIFSDPSAFADGASGGFNFADFASSFSKIVPGIASTITAFKGGKPAGNVPQNNAGQKPQPGGSSLPSWLLPAGAAAGVVGLLVAITKR